MILRPFLDALISETQQSFPPGPGGPAPLILDYRFDEPMAAHTTFKVGGPADLWLRPGGELFSLFTGLLLSRAGEAGFPVFILGGGANLVVSDRGIRGIVLDTGDWTGIEQEAGGLYVKSGTSIDEITEYAARQGLSGLEFLAGLPGTLGGAVWMNARCYEKSVSDILGETEILVVNGKTAERRRVSRYPGDFSYKRSPFQGQDKLILGARLSVSRGDPEKIRREMTEYREDRERKGHYRYPSAGSVFKNNRDFGSSTGQIIEELGLRGLHLGGARIAPWHGNIIINTGNAGAADIRSLADLVAARAKAERGLELEREILFVGDWEETGAESPAEKRNIDNETRGNL
ncbi:MAG: UDP-N-acetylmuramate dehydrogenase [Treponema sp.]|jgi:UDP-N-acetylmuramate dehydrogenase|nr:UDP-N-acetylmuramate dehydrogenase [Treponema sp.]